MSCLDRSQIETSVDGAFSDLISNMALACEQMDTEQKHGLFMMAGRIKLIWNSTTNQNDVSWDTSIGTTINAVTSPGGIAFTSGTPGKIELSFPSKFTSGGKTVRTISAVALPSVNLVDTEYNFKQTAYRLAADMTGTSTILTLSRDVDLTANFTYNSGWGVGAYVPFGNAFLATKPGGVIQVGTVGSDTTSFELQGYEGLVGLPTLTPLSPGILPLASLGANSNTFNVKVYNIPGNAVLGNTSIPNGTSFAADFGTASIVADARTAKVNTYIWFCGIYQSA